MNSADVGMSESRRRSRTLTSLSAVLVCIWMSACGGSKGAIHSPRSIATVGRLTPGAMDELLTMHGLPNDEDGSLDRESRTTGYLDADDVTVSQFGHPAGKVEVKTITSLFKRYQTATRTANGAKACSLIFSLFEEAIAEDYGRDAGPMYARGGTCAVVLSKIFRHERRRFGIVYKVTEVRVNGKKALVLLGAITAPASYIALQREGTTWKIDMPFRRPLP